MSTRVLGCVWQGGGQGTGDKCVMERVLVNELCVLLWPRVLHCRIYCTIEPGQILSSSVSVACQDTYLNKSLVH